ncbi:hypothetical protein FACS1894202_03640 [Clostridia bacterium]|nr:hypothetical protein FACS1894202_03640 [Clostridia bacterium]
MDFLSVKEVAELKGCSERNIRKLIKDGKLAAEVVPGVTPKTYRVPVSALPQSLKRKYYGKRQLELAPLDPMCDTTRRAIDTYTDSERGQIAFWSAMVREWRESNETAEKFVRSKKLEDLDLSVGTLYRKEKALRDGDMDSLTDKRGQATRGASGIPDKLWEVFFQAYYTQQRKSLNYCVDITRAWTEKNAPEHLADFPSYKQFWTREKTTDKATRTLLRYGNKAYEDECAPFIKRDYSKLYSNDLWVGDNHELDILSRENPHSRPHRLYLTAYIDQLSGAFMGINTSMHPDSNSTVYTFGSGARRYGKPKNVLQDNGREYTAKDIGVGKRKRAKVKLPPTILELLSVGTIYAQVAHGQSKTIERTFGTLANQFSKLWSTYCGNNVLNKPEQLKKILKSEDIPLDSEVIKALEAYCFGYFNHQPYTGDIKAFRDMTREEVFVANLPSEGQQVLTEEQWRIMLMRHSHLQKITQRGVHIKVAGQWLDYFNEELLSNMDDSKQYWVKYDPKDLSFVHVYREDNSYWLTAPRDETMLIGVLDNVTNISEAIHTKNKLIRSQKLQAKLMSKISSENKIDFFAVMSGQWDKHSERGDVRGKIIKPFSPNPGIMPTIDGITNITIDVDKANRNAERRNELKEVSMA